MAVVVRSHIWVGVLPEEDSAGAAVGAVGGMPVGADKEEHNVEGDGCAVLDNCMPSCMCM